MIPVFKRSPFRYPGGKTKKSIQKLILSYCPDDTIEYREPFVGGGGIFWAMDPKINRWINDINSGLISVYEALRDRSEDFINKCKEILAAQPGEEEVATKGTGKKYNKRLGEVFNFLKYNKEVDQALRYFFINRTVWGGRVTYDPTMESRMYYSNPAGWNIVNTNRLYESAKHMQGVKITNEDYSTVLSAPGEKVWIYLDPPYLVDTTSNKGSKLYEFGFTEKDHARFVDQVRKCSHKICISYDNCPSIKEWFAGDSFYIYEHKWTYCGSSLKEKQIGEELIITNYPKNKGVDDLF